MVDQELDFLLDQTSPEIKTLISKRLIELEPSFIDLLQPVTIKIRKTRRMSASQFFNIVLSTAEDIFDLEIRKQTHSREYVYPRTIVAWIVRECSPYPMSLEKIGVYLGGRHHATILHGLRLFSNMTETDPEFREMTVMVIARLAEKGFVQPLYTYQRFIKRFGLLLPADLQNYLCSFETIDEDDKPFRANIESGDQSEPVLHPVLPTE